MKYNNRNILKVLVASTVSALFAGCVGIFSPPPPKVFNYPYDQALTASLNNKRGNNTIKGSALLRQRGGGIVTCAGNVVRLFPKTDYSSERVFDYFGSETEGYFNHPYAYVVNFKLGLEDDEFKESVCDGTGNFEFDKIGDGEYFLVTTVTWEVPSQYGMNGQGGRLMKYVKVKGNEAKRVILSQ